MGWSRLPPCTIDAKTRETHTDPRRCCSVTIARTSFVRDGRLTDSSLHQSHELRLSRSFSTGPTTVCRDDNSISAWLICTPDFGTTVLLTSLLTAGAAGG